MNKLHFNPVKINRDVDATGPDALKGATYRKYTPDYYGGDRYGRVKVCYYKNERVPELLPGVENLSPELQTLATEITNNLQLTDLRSHKQLKCTNFHAFWTKIGLCCVCVYSINKTPWLLAFPPHRLLFKLFIFHSFIIHYLHLTLVILCQY